MPAHAPSCRCRACQVARRDPTPVEIRQRCAEVQATWSRRERRKRMGAYVPQRVVAPFVVLGPLVQGGDGNYGRYCWSSEA